MTKRGDFDFVVVLIIALVVLLVLGVFNQRLLGAQSQAEDTEICHTSVLARAATRIPIISPEGAVPLQCKTTYETISEPDIDEIRRQLANKMVDCWWQMGEGKYDFFGDVDEDRPRCVICSVHSFVPELAKKYPGGLEGFTRYLAQEKIPGKDQTYLQYLTKNPESTGYYTKQTINDVLDLHKKYAVLIANGDKTTWSRVFSFTGKGALIGGGTAAALVGLAMFTPLAPAAAGIAVLVGAGVLGGGGAGAYFSDEFPDNVYTTLLLIPYDDSLKGACSSLG